MKLLLNPLSKLIDAYLSKEALPYWCVLLADCIIVFVSGFIGYCVEFTVVDVLANIWHVFAFLLLFVLCCLVGFRIKHTYSGMMRYSTIDDLLRIGVAMLIGGGISFGITLLFSCCDTGLVPGWKTVVWMFLLGVLFMVFLRVIAKALYDSYKLSSRNKSIGVFIFGTLHGGLSLAHGMRSGVSTRFNVKGFINANPEGRTNTRLMGLRVYSVEDDLIAAMKSKRATGLVVSPIQHDNFLARQDLIDKLMDAGIHIFMLPDAVDWDGVSDINQGSLKEVEVEDLLPRDKIEVDLDAIGALLKDKKILITGAAGSIGSEMVRQVALFKPASMVLIDQAETPMHDIRRMMAKDFPDIKALTVVTSITNKEHMEKLFSEHCPDYVFHAAAYKHVPMMEDNPGLAVQNNIYGTRVIADLAVKYNTKKFVMISTDKAVNPTNVMGCSKRICEIYCQSLNKAIQDGKVKGITQFVTTRFGNVLGSNGSVIPIFREQIKNGGPVTVTDENIIRFFMLIPEACRLVLQAGTMGNGGEIFVFDMGKPVRIIDLARRMIKLSGAKNVEVKITGLRDGEKLYEEVLNDAEQTKQTTHPKIKVAAVREYDYETACYNEERLLKQSYTFDDMAIVKIMKEIVPEYKSNSSKYEVLDK